MTIISFFSVFLLLAKYYTKHSMCVMAFAPVPVLIAIIQIRILKLMRSSHTQGRTTGQCRSGFPPVSVLICHAALHPGCFC